MPRKRKTARPRKLRRNPTARALASGLYRQKVEKPPDGRRRPSRRPKHPKPIGADEEA
jgi:stalled ribosome alternative rescue factor ArfA